MNYFLSLIFLGLGVFAGNVLWGVIFPKDRTIKEGIVMGIISFILTIIFGWIIHFFI